MVSYEKVSLFALAVALASLSVKQGYGVQGLVVTLLVTSQLRETHMAATVLLPIVLLAERCLQTTMSLGHSPLPFYSSALFAYLSSFPGASARPAWQWVLAGGTAGCLLALLTGNLAAGAAVVAHAWVGGAAFGALQSGAARLSRREATLVAAIAGFLAFDAVVNSKLVLDGDETANLRDAAAESSPPGTSQQQQTFLSQLRASQITSFPHVAGRNALLCAVAVIWAAAYLASRSAPPRTHATAGRVATRGDSAAVLSSWKFFAVLCAAVGGSFLCTAILFDENPLVWLWAYIVSKPLRSSALAIWFTAIPITVLAVAVFGSDWRPLVRRKVYHALAVVMFAPMAVLDPQFLLFAITVATALGCMLECARFFRVAGTTKGLERFLRSQIDDRDDGIIRTHLYLLFGFGLSMFLRYRAELVLSRSPHKIMQLMLDVIPGVVALGLVDSFAAIVGSRWPSGQPSASQRGGHTGKLPQSRRYPLAHYLCNRVFPEADNVALTHKTLAGLVGGCVAGSVAWALLLLVVGVPLLHPWSLVGFASVAGSAWFEATCAGIDNLELPLLVYGVSSAAAAYLYN